MIPVCEPLVTSRDIELVNEALTSGWISSAGKYLDLFEERWAEYCGMPFGVAVSNGSTALDIAVDLLALEPGDEVIMPSFTIISPAQSVIRAGGVPVLVDSDPFTWQMDADQVAARVTSRTRAILVVHIYGHPADMDPIMAVASRHGLTVIEDAAEAHGAVYKGRVCGGIGHISTFSFYANKLVTTGEGGMVLVKRREHAERARMLRNLCFQPGKRFVHETMGHNHRMTNIQAAMGVGQLERIHETIDRKRELAHYYNGALSGISEIQLPAEMPWARSVYWVYGIVLGGDRNAGAAQVIADLAAEGIEARPFFWGMHEQPVFKRMGLFGRDQHPVAANLARRGLYIPNGLNLTFADLDRIIECLRRVLA